MLINLLLCPSTLLPHPSPSRGEQGPCHQHQPQPDVPHEVDAAPVAHSRLKAEQQEAHTHVLKHPHLEEPAQPIKQLLLPWRLTITESRGKHFVDHHGRWDSEETEVVAGMDAMPVGTHPHRHGNPANTQHDGE